MEHDSVEKRPRLSNTKLPDTVIIRQNDSGSDSSGTNTTLGSAPSRMRSRNSFARRRRETTDDRRTQSPPRKAASRITPEHADTPKRKSRSAAEKPKRRIVIGSNNLVPHRLRPAFILFMKLRARYKLCCVILMCFVYISCRKSIRRTRIKYFGEHPIHGGKWGVKWDQANIQRVMKETHEKKCAELEALGVVLPDTGPPTHLLELDTHAALREHLVRREARSQHLIHIEAVAEVYQRGCVETKEGPLRAFFHKSDGSFHDVGIPKHIFVPDITSWKRPRPGKPASFVHLTFDETEMRLLIADNYLPLLSTFESLKTLEDRIHLWSICALYIYGGVFLGPNAVAQADVIRDIVDSSANGLFSGVHNHCSSPTGLAVFDKTEGSDGKASMEVLMMAATPRHPHLRCVMNQLESAADAVEASRVLKSLFLDDTWESSHTFHHLTKTQHEAPLWEMLTTQCGYGHAHTQQCCHGMNFHEVQELPVDDSTPTQGNFYVQLLEAEEPKNSNEGGGTVQVDVRENEFTEAPLKSEKISLEHVMEEKNIAPGWLCTRCLKTALYGTLEKCSKVCNSGYENLMCNAPDEPEKAEIVVEVTVDAATADAKRIPRIVHQTWFEELSSDRYPELVRLQNSWKRSGWEYRFYTDETARKFILDNFPDRFADAFDALIPGAYKADLFRYLVLMKEGGVYADVDILLDASLDDFVTPNLSFFAPRDVVCEYADESFCLWNGIIGSAPGHPFMIRAVERLVNLILERADLYDMERDVCRRVGREMENWKVRAEPLLLASGPCALGVAVNDMIGHESLAKLDIGWIPSDAILDESGRDHGDALILVGDKFDLGNFRISDPERSYILASTDLPGVTKDSRELSNPTRGEIRRRQHRRGPLPHYSEAGRGEFVWGMHDVYHDNLVNNEVIKFNVVYK